MHLRVQSELSESVKSLIEVPYGLNYIRERGGVDHHEYTLLTAGPSSASRPAGASNLEAENCVAIEQDSGDEGNLGRGKILEDRSTIFCEEKGPGNRAGYCGDYASWGSGCLVKGFGCACSSRTLRKVARKSSADENSLHELPRAMRNFDCCKSCSWVGPMSGCKGQDLQNINCWTTTGTRMRSCLCMDSEMVSGVGGPTWERGGNEIPRDQGYQGGVGDVGDVGGRLTASFLSTNQARLRSWGVKTWRR